MRTITESPKSFSLGVHEWKNIEPRKLTMAEIEKMCPPGSPRELPGGIEWLIKNGQKGPDDDYPAFDLVNLDGDE